MTGGISKLDIETGIHDVMVLAIALAELVDSSLMEPDRQADGLFYFSMTPGQVDARLAMTKLTSDKAGALRDLFHAWMRDERKAVQA